MKQQNSKWYERYSVTPHPLGMMFTLWGIRGIVSEPLGDYPRESDALEAMEKLKAEDRPRVEFGRVLLSAVQSADGRWVIKSPSGLWVAVVAGNGVIGNEAYAKLFAASPKLLAFAEAYLEAVEDAAGDGDEVEALARMADQARAAVDEARGRV